MKPTAKQIRNQIKKLRKIIDGNQKEEILCRIAYAVETALTWATEETVGWDTPSKDVFEEAAILKEQLKLPA